MKIEKSLNLAIVIIGPLGIWLGSTGRVSWWIIVLIFISCCRVNFEW